MANSKKLGSTGEQKIRTIGDLKAYMEKNGLSPEALSSKISLSNMTIRRMMERKPSEVISEKYWHLFDRLFADNLNTHEPHQLDAHSQLFGDFDLLTSDLEKAGMKEPDLEKVEDDVHAKMESEPIGKGLKSSLKLLLKTMSGPKVPMSSRAIAVGALLYFLNPVDLIPDALPGVGYLDDLSVATVAISAIVKRSKATDEDRKKSAKQKK